ncbi:sporulation protein YqfC [Paenibacillus sp. PCH8]|uniref:Sporulation protein, YqfC n=1 Tax=Paenibacillus amylolyticus TaxID=1451 RepID=A0A117I236_PAEAM|nr:MULTISPECIES: sporulation protein YqfC [Paenibacillus]PQP80565.1 sporulation protein YqfC [Paenibacillus sp. PCH8]GAS83102.1 sporulation protein, YqfC [Paenibacillus amylolyticus]
MTRISRKLRRWTSEVLDLPQDVLYDMPRLTLIGSKQLYIENHRGVIHFTPDRIVLALSQGQLEIKGTALVIRNILPDEVAVEGTILDIHMNGVEGNR